MNKYILLQSTILLFLSVFSACNSSKEYENSQLFNLESFKQTKTLKGTPLLLDEPVKTPARIYTIDSFLVLINMHTNIFVDRYNLNTSKKTGEYISFGSGPEEMITPKNIITEDSIVYTFDLGKKRLVQYDKYDFCHNKSPSLEKTINFDEFVSNLQLLKNGTIVTTIHSPEHKRLSFFNLNGEFIETKGEYPVIRNQELNTIQKMSGYDCSIITNEDKDKIFIAYKLTDLIEIYDINGNLITRKQGPEGFFPSIIVHNNGDMQTIGYEKDKSKDGYFCPIAYNDEIYVLYSGKTYNPDKHDFNSDHIFVFDWNGNPIRTYNLETPIFSFTIDPKTNTLYGITNNPEYHIVTMQL